MARKKRRAKRPSALPRSGSRSPGAQIPPVALRLGMAALFALLLAHAVVFGWRLMSAERIASPDWFNYVAISRNLSEGHGFTQSAPGFNQPSFWGDRFAPDFPPRTDSKHSVLYPLLIAATAGASGLPHGDASHLASGLAYFAALALVFLLGFRLWGAGAGLLSAAVFAWPWSTPAGEQKDPFICSRAGDWLPTDWLFSCSLTESAGTAMLFGVLALLAKNPGGRAFLAAGALVGLAILQRTAMLPLVGVGALAALMRPAGQWRMLALFLAGAGVVGGLRALPGSGVAYDVYASIPMRSIPDLLRHHLIPIGAVPFLVLGALAAAAFWREDFGGLGGRRWRGRLREIFSRFHGEILLLAWMAGHSVQVAAVASVVNFVGVGDPRIVFSTKIAMAPLAAGLAWRALPGGRARTVLAAGVFALAMFTGIARDWGVLAEGRDVSDRARIASSEMLRWADENIRAGDFVMGEDVMEFPHYFSARVESAPSFSPYPFSPIVSEGRVEALVRHRCGEFGNYYLFTRRRGGDFGPFLNGLRAGRSSAKTEVVAALADGIVHRLKHCE